jgi:hypothetical protein
LKHHFAFLGIDIVTTPALIQALITYDLIAIKMNEINPSISPSSQNENNIEK